MFRYLGVMVAAVFALLAPVELPDFDFYFRGM